MAAQYHNSLISFPLDLNQDYDQCKQLPLQDPRAFSSSSSLSAHSFPDIEDHGGSYYRESPLFQRREADLAFLRHRDRSHNHLAAENVSESEFSITVLKKEETNDSPSEKGSVKWMYSKIRLMPKMMSSNLEEEGNSTQKKIRRIKSDDQSSGIKSSCIATIRVCSDCSTTKTPLWRSGPRGPKSLCNACGIRRRKARRAMAAAAMVVSEQTKSDMVQKKEKKRCKVGKTSNNGGKGLCFEDMAAKLRKHSAFQRVFPQDEKEAAILLMALSYGLVHG